MNEPIRILQVFGRLDRGGAETRTMDIYRNIDRNLIQFDFIVHTDDKCVYDDEVITLGGKIYKGIPRYKVYNAISYYKAWEQFFKTNKYTVIHVHTVNSAVPIFIAAKKNHIQNRIAHARQADEYSLFRRLYNIFNKPFLGKLAKYKLAVSELAGKFIFNKQFVIIKNAIDSKSYSYSIVTRERIIKEMNCKDKVNICHIGSFYVVKNHFFILYIFSRLLEHMPNARLYLIGDGELRSKVENKAKEIGVIDNVYMLGVRDDIPDLLQAMDLLLLPSFYEGLPGVALEAQAAGMKVLLSDRITKEVMVVPELVEFLSIDKGPDIWVNRIINITKTGYVRRDTHEDFVNAGYDIISIAKWYEEFYLDMINTDKR